MGGSPLSAKLNSPEAICIFADSLYLSDFNNSVIRKITGLTQLHISENKVSGLKIIPNPNAGLFKIELPTNITEPISFWITDILGRAIKDGVISEKITTIDLRKFEPNIYFLKILMKNNIQTEKIILIK